MKQPSLFKTQMLHSSSNCPTCSFTFQNRPVALVFKLSEMWLYSSKHSCCACLKLSTKKLLSIKRDMHDLYWNLASAISNCSEKKLSLSRAVFFYSPGKVSPLPHAHQDTTCRTQQQQTVCVELTRRPQQIHPHVTWGSNVCSSRGSVFRFSQRLQRDRNNSDRQWPVLACLLNVPSTC